MDLLLLVSSQCDEERVEGYKWWAPCFMHHLHIFHGAQGSGWDPAAGRRLWCISSKYAFCKLTLPGTESKDVY